MPRFSKESPDIETSSLEYAKRFDGEVGRYFLEVQEHCVLKMLDILHVRTVLDVGGGHGQILNPLIRNGYDVTVFGSGVSCKDRLREIVSPHDRYQFVVGDLYNLPFPDRSFDAVVSLRLLPHLSQWKTMISELARVSRHGLIVDYPTVCSVNFFSPILFRIKKWVEGNTRPYGLFSTRSIGSELEKNGFRCELARGQFLLPMAFYRLAGKCSVLFLLEDAIRNAGLTDWIGSPVIALARRCHVP